MTLDEFINICLLGGYASTKTVKQYCKQTGRDNFTDEDIIEVHRINERTNDLKNNVLKHSSGIKKSGDSLLNSLDRKPTPWNQVFNPKRGKIPEKS